MTIQRHRRIRAPAHLIDPVFTMASTEKERDKSKVHKLSLKGSAKLVAEFVGAVWNPRAMDAELTFGLF